MKTKKTTTPDQFDAVMRRLVRVPKAEVDAEEAKWQAQRELLKKKGETKAKRRRKD